MNHVEFLAMLVNLFLSCSAMEMSEQKIGGESYQVQRWECGTTNGMLHVKTFRRPCNTGHAEYWGRMVFMEFEEIQTSVYMNRFGEVQDGLGATIEEAYRTPCGS